MSLRLLPALLGTALALGAIGCVLPDIHDNNAEAGSAGSGNGTSSSAGAAGGGTTGTPGAGGAGGTSTAGGAGGTAGSGGTAAACAGSTTVGLRFANVSPALGAVDFCLGHAGNLSGPVALLAGAPGGADYSFSMHYDYNVSGPITIRAVPAGGSCSGESLGDLTDLCLTDASGKSTATVYYVAGQAGGPALVALRDEQPDPSALKLRFFNAIQGTGSTDFGLTSGTTLSTAIATNVAFAHVPPAGNTILNAPVNAEGYLELSQIPSGITWEGWGVALSGGNKASASIPFTSVDANMGVLLTVVAVGKAGDPAYPIQFLGFAQQDAGGGGGPTKPTQTPTADTGLQ